MGRSSGRGSRPGSSFLKQCLQLLWPQTSEPPHHVAGTVDGATVVGDMSCVRCGHCCCYLLVKLTTGDIRMLAQGLGLSNHDVLRRYVTMTSVGPVLRQDGDRCVFLSGGHDGIMAVCNIYAFRPQACRRWTPSTSRLECQEGLRKQSSDRVSHIC